MVAATAQASPPFAVPPSTRRAASRDAHAQQFTGDQAGDLLVVGKQHVHVAGLDSWLHVAEGRLHVVAGAIPGSAWAGIVLGMQLVLRGALRARLRHRFGRGKLCALAGQRGTWRCVAFRFVCLGASDQIYSACELRERHCLLACVGETMASQTAKQKLEAEVTAYRDLQQGAPCTAGAVACANRLWAGRVAADAPCLLVGNSDEQGGERTTAVRSTAERERHGHEGMCTGVALAAARPDGAGPPLTPSVSLD